MNFLKNLFGGGSASAAYANLNPNDFGQKIAQHIYNRDKGVTEGVVLDVRTADEFKSGHLPKAINANVMSNELITKAAKLNKAQPVFVYCRSGARSARACKTLANMGFTDVYNMSGGISSWTGKVVK